MEYSRLRAQNGTIVAASAPGLLIVIGSSADFSTGPVVAIAQTPRVQVPFLKTAVLKPRDSKRQLLASAV
jgi:hypothetical protein